MKAKGIMRRIDRRGSVVLPNELRVQLIISKGIKGIWFQMYADGSMIALAEYVKGGLTCGGR